MADTEYTPYTEYPDQIGAPHPGGIGLVEMVIVGIVMAALIVGGVISASRVSPEEIRDLDTFYVYVPVT